MWLNKIVSLNQYDFDQIIQAKSSHISVADASMPAADAYLGKKHIKNSHRKAIGTTEMKEVR